MSAYTITDSKLKNVQMVSVTTILDELNKPWLTPWALDCYQAKIKELLDLDDGQSLDDIIDTAKKEYKTVKQYACDIGTQVHDAIEQYIKTGADLTGTLKPEVENGFLAFLEWEKANVKKWIEVETKIYHPHLIYAGTYDGIFESLDGRIVLVDFKTSKAIYDSYWLQVASYMHARESIIGTYEVVFTRGQGGTFSYALPSINIDDVAILRLDKETGAPEYKERDRRKIDTDMLAFSGLLTYYYNAKKRRLANNPRVK